MGILIFFLSGLFTVFQHDIHVSMCDVKYNTQSSSFQISVRVFLDDFETSLASQGYENLKILTERESPIADSLIVDYFAKHLKLHSDGKIVSMDFLGKEISDDFLAMWCYLEVYDVDYPKYIQIKNDILLELYNDQQNITSFKVDKKRKGHFLFSKEKIQESLYL